MSDMQSLLDQARALGEAIAAHERVRAFVDAQITVQKDSEAGTLLRDYYQQVEHVQKLQQEQKPIEVSDKQKLAELETKMSTNSVVSGLMRAQADYTELMNQVNNTMGNTLAAKQQEALKPQSA